MTRRDRTVIAIVLVVGAIVGGWLLVIQPKRSEASKLGGQVSAAQAQLDQARAQVAQGQAARSSYARDYTELARLGEAVPPDDNVPSLIYQVQHAASGAGVDFRQLLLQPAAGGAAPVPAPTPAASATSAASTSSSTSTTSTTSAVTPAPAAAVPSASAIAALPPGAAIGPAGFPVEPFSFTFQGSFFHLANFFERLQRFVVATDKRLSVSGRLMTLNAFSFSPGPQGFPQISASVSATTYLVPAAQGLTNGATPSGPSSTPTGQSVSSSSGVSPTPSGASPTPSSASATPTAAISAPVK
jgi:type II secretory pathway pseudopilin PulG